MNRSETAKIQLMLLSALRLTRPIPDEELLLDAWELALGDLDYDACERAATVLLREEKYFPEPSAIRDLVLKERTGLPDTDEAWSMVSRWIRGGQSASPMLSGFAAEAMAEAVRGLGGLYNLRRSERPDRDRADFYKAWPEIRRRYLRTAMETPSAITTISAAEYLRDAIGTLTDASTLDQRSVVTYGEGGEAIEDRGMGLVDYETQAPKPVPQTIVPLRDATRGKI